MTVCQGRGENIHWGGAHIIVIQGRKKRENGRHGERTVEGAGGTLCRGELSHRKVKREKGGCPDSGV